MIDAVCHPAEEAFLRPIADAAGANLYVSHNGPPVGTVYLHPNGGLSGKPQIWRLACPWNFIGEYTYD